jgi:hypothetical protein
MATQTSDSDPSATGLAGACLSSKLRPRRVGTNLMCFDFTETVKLYLNILILNRALRACFLIREGDAARAVSKGDVGGAELYCFVVCCVEGYLAWKAEAVR